MRVHATSIISASCILAILYFGRDVLEPLACAGILSLVLAPLVHSFERIGLGRVPSTLLSVALGGSFVIGLALVLASQLGAVTADLPQYRKAIVAKLDTIREVTERPLARIEAELNAGIPAVATAPTPSLNSRSAAARQQPIPVEIRQPRLTTKETVGRLFALMWGPLGKAGIVLVLLVFISLEHESLTERVVRLTGETEISRTVKALADAAEGISRFFFAQFIVNATFGAMIGLTLWVAGVPHAALWGTLSAVLRFVPYLGILIAGAAIALFVAAVEPGWALAAGCVGVFLVLELLAANVVEPKVYGHSAGLSPLAIIVSALFWGTIWGPVGLLLSTPLTLCLVVAGRHVRSLSPFTILLGAATDVTAAQRFYQRALSGDTSAVLRDARRYLRRHSLARYCDDVLLPGLGMSLPEFRNGNIDELQQERIRSTIVEVAEALAPTSAGGARRRRKASPPADGNVGAYLRKLREERFGQWQGSLDVPSHSVALCVGLAAARDDFLCELLVRALRESGIDARSVSLGSGEEHPGLENAHLVAVVFIPYPEEESMAQWIEAVGDLRTALPAASLIAIQLEMDLPVPDHHAVHSRVDLLVSSFNEALEVAGSASHTV